MKQSLNERKQIEGKKKQAVKSSTNGDRSLVTPNSSDGEADDGVNKTDDTSDATSSTRVVKRKFGLTGAERAKRWRENKKKKQQQAVKAAQES